MRVAIRISIICLLAAVTAACAQSARRERDAGSVVSLTAQADEGSFEERARRVLGAGASRPQSPGGLDEDLLYKFLLAEIAGQRGNMQLAAQAYLDMARSTKDARIARRATEIALYAKLEDVAMEAARIWLAAEENSPAARQTLATLLVNSRNLPAAKPLLAESLSAEGANVGRALLSLQGVLGKHPDKAAVFALVEELIKPYLDRPEAHYARAEAAFGADQFEASRAAVRKALKLRPDWEQAVLFESHLIAREDRARGLEYLKAYLQARPAAHEIRLNYARGLIAERRYPEARVEFEKLLENNKSNADVAFTIALLSVQISDFESADVQLRRALDLGYKDADSVRFQLGEVNEEMKRFEEAGRWYQSVQGGGQLLTAQARYALMLARQQRVDEARRYLRNLQAQDEAQRVQLIQAESHLLRATKNYKAAYDVLRDALDAQPDQPELLYDIALAAEKLDRIDVLESSLQRLITLKPDHAQAYNALGYTLADRTDRLVEARSYIEKALQLSPEDPFILDSMGWVHYRLGNLKEGLEYLRRAYAQRKDPEIAAHLGEVLWVKGQLDEARKIWRSSLEDNPESEELQNVMRKFIK